MAVDLTQFGRKPVNPSLQGGIDLTQYTSRVENVERPGPQTLGQEFEQGVSRGTLQTEALLFGLADLAGSMLRSEEMRRWAQEGVSTSLDRAEQFAATEASGINATFGDGDFLTWAVGAIGEQIPNLAATIGAGGVGGALARTALKRSLTHQLAARASQELGGGAAARRVARLALHSPSTQRALRAATLRGSGGGAALVSGGLNTGDIQNELTEAGIESPLTALAGGAIAGVLDAAPVVALLDRVFPGVDRKLAQGFTDDLMKTMGMQFALEGSTEAAQEAVLLASRAFHDPSLDITSPASRERILEAAAAGALVGAVTGGVGEAAGRGPQVVANAATTVRAANDRVRNFIETKANFERIRNSTKEQEADTVWPGLGELRAAAMDTVKEHFVPFGNAVRDSVRTGVDAAKRGLGTEGLGIDVEGILTGVEERYQRNLAPLMADAMELANQQINTIRDTLGDIAEGERAQYMKAQFDKLRQDIKNFVDERVGPTAKAAEDDFVQETETRDYDDEDPFVDDVDPDETADRQAVTRTVFGRPISKARATKSGSVSVSVRSRDDNVVGYASRQEAEEQVERIQGLFHEEEILPGAFDVEQLEDGTWGISVSEAVDPEAIFAQLRFIDGLDDARLSARAGEAPDGRSIAKRKIKVRGIDPEGRSTRLDVPTLAFAGMDMLERQGGVVPENRNKAMVRGLDEMLSRMTDQGIEVDFDQLNDAELHNGLTVGQARGRAQFAPDTGSFQRDEGPLFDRSTDTDLGTAQENVTSTEEAQNLESRRRPRDKVTSKHDRLAFKRSKDKKVYVGVSGATDAQEDLILDLVTELTKIAGLSDTVTVVDDMGARRMLESGGFDEAVLNKMREDDPPGRIVSRAGESIIYISPKVYQGKNAGPNTVAVLAHELGHLVEFSWHRRAAPQLQEKLRQAHEDSGSNKVFEEWMADQFVGWSVRQREPSNAVERFFARVADMMRKIFDMLRGKYGLNETYAEFMRGVRAAVLEEDGNVNPWGRYFVSQGITGKAHFAQSRNFDVNDLLPQAGLRAKVKALLNKYPGAKQAASRFWQTTLSLHDTVTSSLNGRMRRIAERVPAFAEIADMFNKNPGEAGSASYYSRINRMRGLFSKEFNRILRNEDGTEKFTDEQKQEILDELISGDVTSEAAAGVRDTLDQMYNYMRDQGLPVERIENYFPRVWDREKVAENYDSIKAELESRGFSARQAKIMVNHMGNMPFDGELDPQADGMYELPYQGFLERRAKVLDDPIFNQFRMRDLDRILENYVNGVVKRAEFNKILGQDAEKMAEWNPRERLEALRAKAMEQGATQADMDFLDKALDAYLGRTGRDFSPDVRTAMAWMATYQNVRLLLFSTLASFPDIVGPAIRSGDFRRALKTFRANINEAWSTESDLNEMARTWGIISDKMNQHILTEHFDNHWFPERARRINETFFRAIGLEKWTNFTRSAALAVGRDSIKQWAEQGDSAKLAELGLTVDEVQDWVARGEPVSGSAGYSSVSDTASGVDSKVADALVQFVDEAIMRPNPSQRPEWASHPAAMLLFHLKSFMYAFHDTITRRVIHNMVQAGTPWEKAYALAVPAMAMMAMTALGLELRELVQYPFRTSRTDRMDTDEYLFELLTRTGLFGPAQLAIDFEGADARGQLGAMAIAGPTINQMNEFVSRPMSQTVPKAIPGVGQIPWARDLVRDVTPL